MLGDSHCRWMVNDLCSSHLCVSDDWGKGEFHYQQPCAICEAQHKANIRTRPTIAATTLCTTPPGDRLGLLMVYGLKSTGPYLYNISNNQNDTRVDSSVRLCAGVTAFSSRVHVPDAIALSSVAWDLSAEWSQLPDHNASDWKARGHFHPSTAALAAYEANLRARVHEVAACKAPTTRIYLQTTRSFGQRAFNAYNDVIRRVAATPAPGLASGLIDIDRLMERGRFDPVGLDRRQNCDSYCVRRVRNEDDAHVNAWHSASAARFVLDKIRRDGIGEFRGEGV